MKILTTNTLRIWPLVTLLLTISAHAGQYVSSHELVGKWEFDMWRFAQERARDKGIDLGLVATEQHVPAQGEVAELYSATSDQSSSAVLNGLIGHGESVPDFTLPMMLITEETITVPARPPYSRERVMSYTIIGGNAQFAIIEYTMPLNDFLYTAYIWIESDHMVFASPTCAENPEQCEQFKQDMKQELKQQNADTMSGIEPAVNDESLEELMGQKIYFRRAS